MTPISTKRGAASTVIVSFGRFRRLQSIEQIVLKGADHVFVTDRRLLLGRHGRRHLATTASAALPIASASFSIASTARDRSTPSRSSALKAAIIAVIAAAMA